MKSMGVAVASVEEVEWRWRWKLISWSDGFGIPTWDTVVEAVVESSVFALAEGT